MNNTQEITEAVILLGGMGTRMLPYTKTVPKEMLPIYDVPTIFKIVEEAYLSGIRKIIFVVTKHNIELIERFFSKDSYLEEFLKDKPEKSKLLDKINKIIQNMTFEFVYQELKGTYGALYSARYNIKSDNFIVMYGDDLIDSSVPLTKQLIESFNKTGKEQVALYNMRDSLPDVGIAVIDKDNNLINLVPKSKTNSTLILHGRMLLNKKIFDVIDKLKIHENDELYLPYALLNFDDVYGYIYEGEYFNIGEKTGYLKASIHYLLKEGKEKDDILKYINKIKEDYG